MRTRYKGHKNSIQWNQKLTKFTGKSSRCDKTIPIKWLLLTGERIKSSLIGKQIKASKQALKQKKRRFCNAKGIVCITVVGLIQISNVLIMGLRFIIR